VKTSELKRAVDEEFGNPYGGVLLRDHWLRALSGTAEEALARGERPRDVWLALCEELDVPLERWHGRGMREPKK